MALVGTPEHRGSTLIVTGVAGTGDNSVVIQLDDVSRFNEFTIMTSNGSVDVNVSYDGVTFSSASLPIALEDTTSVTPATRIVATVALAPAYFRGNVKAIRIQQVGATNIVDSWLMCGVSSRS